MLCWTGLSSASSSKDCPATVRKLLREGSDSPSAGWRGWGREAQTGTYRVIHCQTDEGERVSGRESERASERVSQRALTSTPQAATCYLQPQSLAAHSQAAKITPLPTPPCLPTVNETPPGRIVFQSDASLLCHFLRQAPTEPQCCPS